LAGTSHGGQFAINALIKRPQLFDGIIAISPSLYWNDQQMLGLAEAALKKQDLAGRLFLSIANEEPLMTGSFEQLIALTKKYQNPNLLISAKTFHDESHNSTTLLGQYDGLKHLFAGWAIPDKPQTLADLQAIFNARSKLLGETLQIPEDRANGYGQWLQYSNRQADAIELFRWNRKTYPQSFNTHTALIKAYLHFNLTKEAQAAVAEANKTIKNLSTAQQAELKSLVPALISRLSTDLSDWAGVAKITQLDLKQRQLVQGVRFCHGAVTSTVVALTHPAQRYLNVARRSFNGLAGHEAELEMLRVAMEK
jgi:hypothetical protein